jgi:hypothetical protein
MPEVKRIGPAEVRQRLSAGALFVCAYEGEQLFKRNHLEGAMSLQEFQSRLPSLDKNQEIILYCA